MVRVVFLHPDLGLGGAERLVVDAALALISKGIRTWFEMIQVTKEQLFNICLTIIIDSSSTFFICTMLNFRNRRYEYKI